MDDPYPDIELLDIDQTGGSDFFMNLDSGPTSSNYQQAYFNRFIPVVLFIICFFVFLASLHKK